jgi:hypothetical protein
MLAKITDLTVKNHEYSYYVLIMYKYIWDCLSTNHHYLVAV